MSKKWYKILNHTYTSYMNRKCGFVTEEFEHGFTLELYPPYNNRELFFFKEGLEKLPDEFHALDEESKKLYLAL